MKFIKSYKDPRRIYFLLEYVRGFDLYVIMRHIGLLSNKDSIFYTASLLLALEYLHGRDILYRDLKPENVIIDQDGFVKLIDFGTAKLVQGKTYTLVGTPFYVAPEVIVGRGYGKSADLWSLGVMIYEFLCGRVPFGHNEEDPYCVYEAILRNDVEISPDVPVPTDAALSLLKRLLNKYSDTRQSESVERIKCHEWFNGLDWEDLYCKDIVPPYRPTLKETEEEFEEFTADLDSKWDADIESDSNQSDDPIPEIENQEIQEYVRTIPHNWDQHFA